MICRKCNHVLPDDSEFCQYCGAKIDSSYKTNSTTCVKIDSDINSVKDMKQKILMLAKLSLPCLILSIIMLIICLNIKSGSSNTEILYIVPILISVVSIVLMVINCRLNVYVLPLTVFICLLSVGTVIPFFFADIWADGKFDVFILIMLVASLLLFAINMIVHAYIVITMAIKKYYNSAAYKMRCFEKLDKMNVLREKGIITEEEFAKLKKQIVNKI